MENNFDKEFRDFIYNLDDIVDSFVKKLNQLGFTIDFTKTSINTLENYLLDKHVTIKDDDFYDASCYLGELFKKNYGGDWEIDKNENSKYYKKPVIKNFDPVGMIFSPFSILKETLATREKGALMKILKSSLDDENETEKLNADTKTDKDNYRNRSFIDDLDTNNSIEEEKQSVKKKEEYQAEVNPNQPYKIFKGKAFTKEEWLKFEEEEYQRFSMKNHQHKSNEKPPQTGGGFFLDERESDW